MWTVPRPGWGMVLGLALGGFFDGILLHQILQWHHLLSLVPRLDDIRSQILRDGYFHAATYVIAAVGLWGLWRARSIQMTGRQLLGSLLVGFGAWHLADAVLSHWLLGIHRIKLDSPSPLAWDLGWAFVFGIVPILVGGLLSRGGGSTPNRARASASVAALAIATLGAGSWSMRAPDNQAFTTIVFRPEITPGQVFAALHARDARLVWADQAMGVVVVDVPPHRRWSFYADGAVLVSGTGITGGCLDWSRAEAAAAGRPA